MKTVSMLEFRKDSAAVLAALKRGVRIMLTYRGQPVARIEPISQEPDRESDPLNDIASCAISSPLGPLKHEDLDSLLYE